MAVKVLLAPRASSEETLAQTLTAAENPENHTAQRTIFVRLIVRFQRTKPYDSRYGESCNVVRKSRGFVRTAYDSWPRASILQSCDSEVRKTRLPESYEIVRKSYDFLCKSYDSEARE